MIHSYANWKDRQELWRQNFGASLPLTPQGALLFQRFFNPPWSLAAPAHPELVMHRGFSPLPLTRACCESLVLHLCRKHRGREIPIKASLVYRVAFLAEKAAARFLCPGGTS